VRSDSLAPLQLKTKS